MEMLKYFVPFAVNFARYFLFAGLAFVIFYKIYRIAFKPNKIQKREAGRADFIREVVFSMQTTVILALVIIGILYSPLQQYTLAYTDIHAYPLWWVPVSILLALVLHDTYFYWMHRTLHHPKLFRYTHLTHHKSTNPSPWASYSFGLAEGILEALIAPIILWIIPIHPISLFVFGFLAFFINVYGHLGFEIMPKWFRKTVFFEILTTSVHHNQHHEKFNGNYGLYFRFWDRLMKTENPDYIKHYDAIQNQRFSKQTSPMKSTILTLLLPGMLLGSFSSTAQITYSASDYMQLNDTMLFSQTTLGLSGLDFDTTGANVFWDYSTLDYASQFSSSYFDPQNSGYKNAWCIANGYGFNCNTNFQNLTNLATNNMDSISIGQISIENQVSHQFASGTTLENRMVGLTATIQGSPVPLIFTFDFEDVDTLYQFPLQYTVSDSSNSRLVMQISQAQMAQIRTAKRTNTVEGWGSLATPYGTFNNVLKMKTVIERKDTLVLDTVIIPTSVTQVEYKWWDLAYGLPVLTASGTILGPITTITDVSYLDSTRCVDPNALFSYLPLLPTIDSATQQATVNFNNLSSQVDSVHWDFGDGGTSTAWDPSHSYTSGGTFNVQLILYNTCENQQYSDTLTLPVFITDSTAAGISEVQQSALRIYPNPAQDILHVQFSSEIDHLEVVDLMGNIVLRSREKSIGISTLEKGAYLLRIVSPDDTVSSCAFVKL